MYVRTKQKQTDLFGRGGERNKMRAFPLVTEVLVGTARKKPDCHHHLIASGMRPAVVSRFHQKM